MLMLMLMLAAQARPRLPMLGWLRWLQTQVPGQTVRTMQQEKAWLGLMPRPLWAPAQAKLARWLGHVPLRGPPAQLHDHGHHPVPVH